MVRGPLDAASPQYGVKGALITHCNLAERLDRVRWNRFHATVTIALGVGWLLDAFEVTIVNNVIGVFKDLWHLDNAQTSWILSTWFVGLMIGAYGFVFLAARFGRRRLFPLTLLNYGVFNLLTALAWSYPPLLVLRLLTAVGIGADYSAISEFIPSRNRGRANASVMNFWPLGAILAALGSLYVVNPLPPDIGQRVAFGFGALVAGSLHRSPSAVCSQPEPGFRLIRRFPNSFPTNWARTASASRWPCGVSAPSLRH
ncbi:MFS transporter [Thiomonas sp. FB-Cd]|uniref:MFS transporter n=1 Tax=Thiomonas sp. FB-Cd TaxID=1158292 RepID=UPI0004DF79B5|nr:MFS transporter [Thiomonas sp. FB-Cd]